MSRSLRVCSCRTREGEEHPRAAVLKPLLAGGSRKRGGVTRGAVCVSERPGRSVPVLCPRPGRAGPSPGEQQDLSPLVLEPHSPGGEGKGRLAGTLSSFPTSGTPSPGSFRTFFGFKERVGKMVTRQKRKHI